MEIPLGQAKRGTFSWEFHFCKENVARFYRNSVWTSKTWRIFAEISFGQAKCGTFSQKFRLDEQNVARFHENSVWVRKTARGNACFLRGGRFRRVVEVKIYSADKTCLRFHGNALRKWARSVLTAWLPAGSQNDRRHDCRLRGFESLNHRFFLNHLQQIVQAAFHAGDKFPF